MTEHNGSQHATGLMTLKEIKLKVGEFSGIREAILTLLGDGQKHSRDAVLACLGDPMADWNAMRFHLTRLRRMLQPIGEDIQCTLDRLNKTAWYQLVKILPVTTQD